MQMQSLGAILNMIQNPYLYSDNEAQQNKLINDLQAICRMESEAEKAKQSKFNIYNYVAKDKMRPQMCGVFHDNGHRVASDSHILVVVNESYAESYEGKIILKDGQDAQGSNPDWPLRYPDYKSVFSKAEPDAVRKIDMEAMPDLFKKIKLNEKLGNGVQYIKVPYTDKNGESKTAYYKADKFKLLVDFMRFIGTDELVLRGVSRAVEVCSEKGKGLLMPVRIDEELVPENYHEI